MSKDFIFVVFFMVLGVSAVLGIFILIKGIAARRKLDPEYKKSEWLSFPIYVHVICGWPLVLMLFGGAIGGGLGGAAYGLSVTIYSKTRSLIWTSLTSIMLGVLAFVLWYLIASALRS